MNLTKTADYFKERVMEKALNLLVIVALGYTAYVVWQAVVVFN